MKVTALLLLNRSVNKGAQLVSIGIPTERGRTYHQRLRRYFQRGTPASFLYNFRVLVSR